MQGENNEPFSIGACAPSGNIAGLILASHHQRQINSLSAGAFNEDLLADQRNRGGARPIRTAHRQQVDFHLVGQPLPAGPRAPSG